MGQLGFDFGVQPLRKLARITPARLATFNDCPRRYRLAYVDRPTPKRTGPWAHSTMGAVIHNALRALFAAPVAKRTTARASALVAEHWRDAGFLDARQSATYRAKAQSWVADYLQETDIAATPVGLERWVSVAVNASNGGDVKPSIIIEGRVDRIDQRDDELVIIDYKTGRYVPTGRDAQTSSALAIYAMATEKLLRKPCRRVELHHVPTVSIAVAEYAESDTKEHLTRTETVANEVTAATEVVDAGGDADTLFPAKPSNRCSWCDFRPSCVPGQQAASAARPWDLLAPMAEVS